jgi:hypothetical protein
MAIASSTAPGLVHARATLEGPTVDPAITADQVRSITAEAYIYAYPMIDNYRTMVKQAIDRAAPEYIGGFNVIKNYSEPFTPENHDVVTPNNDTPYSWARVDLRADPFVISVPAVGHDRYYVLQWIDLYTYIVGYIGVRTTGFGAGSYLIAGPDWEGGTPEGIDGVLHCETQFITLLGRTLLEGPDDVPTLGAIQSQYRLEALSQFQAQIPPSAAPEVEWLPWNDEALTTRTFLLYLNFLLQYCQPPHPSEVDLLRRFARIGIAPGAAFDFASLDPAIQQAIDCGVVDGIAKLNAALAATTTSNGLFGTRQELGDDYLKRAVAANKGLYGNAVEEAWYGGWETGADGQPLDGARQYRLHFAPEALPPAQFFWSATMYDLPDRFLVANPINRYSIGDRTEGVQYEADGGLSIEISSEQPPENVSNWLPAPAAPFTVVIRIYGPKQELLDDSWQLPPLEVV